MATAAGDKTMRRRGRRQQSLTPEAIGATLREARDGAAVTLAEVHDRTGVPWQQLEALEAGDLTRFSDRRSALTAVGRYADLMGLDSERFVRVVDDHWGSPDAGFVEPGSRGGRRKKKAVERRAYAAAPAATGPAGHLSRYPGDGSHLRAFTQTAEVPGVTRTQISAGPPPEVSDDSVTGVFPVATVWQVPEHRVPLALRLALWTTTGLLALALGGLAVHHWQPEWLTAIHVVHSPTTTVAPAGGASTATSSPGAKPPVTRSSLVTQTSIGNGSAAISVRAANFTVEVAASGACWVQATTPQSFAPVYEQTLQTGQRATIASADGQLSVHLGSSYVLMAVYIDGKPAPGWLFKPPSAPFILDFTSTGS